jgi:hypothetical protein
MKLSNYYLTGTSKDHEWIIDHRELLEGYIRDEMRENGYIPALDIPMNFVWEYDKEFSCSYKVTAKGLKVGRKRSREAMGYMHEEGFILSKDAGQISVLV